MFSRKRKTRLYSELSEEQKQRKSNRRRALRAQNAGLEDKLFPVHVETAISIEENVELAVTMDSSEMNDSHEHGSSNYYPQQDEDMTGMLCDVSIGTTSSNMMPRPFTKQPPIPTEPYDVSLTQTCKLCHATKLEYESIGFCCSRGEVSLYPIEVPPCLQQLYSGLDTESIHFLKYVKPYNEVFSFTSMGVHLDPVYAKRINGIYSFRAQGQIYHFIGPLRPQPHEKPTSLQLYFFDTENEISNRKRKCDQLEAHLSEKLIEILQHNPYSKFFRSLHDVPNLDEYQNILRGDPLITNYTAMPPSFSQVAAMWIEDQNRPATRERDIKVYQHDGIAQTMSHYFGCYDPLQYPLL